MIFVCVCVCVFTEIPGKRGTLEAEEETFCGRLGATAAAHRT